MIIYLFTANAESLRIKLWEKNGTILPTSFFNVCEPTKIHYYVI